MFLSTNSLSIVNTFSWEYISISSHIVVRPLFNITSVHWPERNIIIQINWALINTVPFLISQKH